jgi:multidrug efflux pump
VAGVRTLTSDQPRGPQHNGGRVQLGADLETAANDVRDQGRRAQRSLPPDADPPTISKADADDMPVP